MTGSPVAVSIRPAAFDDAPAISAVLRAAFTPYEPLYTPAAFAATTLDAERVRDRMAEGLMWVAAEGDRVVGTIGAVVRGHDLYLRGMAVLPAASGRGIGRRLLTHAEAAAWLGGQSRIALSTTPFLDRAIRLYEQHEFVRCDEPPYELKGTPLVSMVKVLRPPVRGGGD